MKRSVGILLLIGWLAIIATYSIARLEVPILIQSELKKIQKSAPLNTEISRLNYNNIDAGFSFSINGSFRLHDVKIQLSQFPEVMLFAPTIEVTGFKRGIIKGIQIDKLYVSAMDKRISDRRADQLKAFSHWFLSVHYYQDEQGQKKNLTINAYDQSYSQPLYLAELKVSAPVENSLIAVLHHWRQQKSIAGVKIEYRDYGLHQQLTRLGLGHEMTAALG